MVSNTNVRVGPPSECSKNLTAALEELRRREDIEWVIEKLTAAGFMNTTEQAEAAGRKKTNTEGTSLKAKRQLLTRSEDGGLPVEGLKWVIRELKLNTGQSFWKKHVTREDFIKVLLFHFKARQPIRHKRPTGSGSRGNSAARPASSNKRGAGTASNYERIRQGLISARARHEIAAEGSTVYPTPSYVGMLAPFQRGAPRVDANKRRLSTDRPLVEKVWRDFEEDTSEGILYQARTGLNPNWKTMKEIALNRAIPTAEGLPETAAVFLAGLDCSKSGGDVSDEENEPRDLETERQEEEATLMRRKCAKSIYELSTRADKGPLLIGNGVLQALSALSLVEDPRTSRYVGASYVNIAALGREVCVDMLKNQVVRCLHRLWQRAYSLAHCRRTSDLSSVSKGSNSKGSNSTGGGSATSAPSVVMETDEEWSVRRCGLDVLDQAAVALCHLSVPIGAESIMMQERGMGAIMWYARGDHDNEQLKVVGLQCLVNFHRNTPNGTFHEAMLPCLKELGQSATTGIRRYTGQAICALGANKQGASQLLAGGVLTILANLSKPDHLTRDGESASGHAEGSGGDGAGGGGIGREGNTAADGLLLEACAHAASNLTVANAEFVRQALIAPATVAEVLEILHLGGDGGGGDGGGGSVGAMKSNANVRGSKRAAACRLNSARVLRSIFSDADASDVARLVQLGFLRKTGQFFGQAAAQEDPKAQQLLAHSVWHLSATLTDVKPLEPQPPPRPHPHRHPPTDSGSPAFTGEAISALSRGGLQQHQQQYKGVRRRSSSNSVLLPGQGESATTTAKSSTATAATNNQGAARGVYGSRNRRRSSGGSSVVSVSVSEANTVRSSRASVRPVDRARGSMILRQNPPGGALSAARGGLVGGRKLVRRRSSTLTEEEESLSETSSHRGGAGLEGGVPRALGSGLSLDTTSGAADSSPSEVAEKKTKRRGDQPVPLPVVPIRTPSVCHQHQPRGQGPHVVACGVMHHLLRLAESGTTGFVRECATGALCNLARKPWITAEICKETKMMQTLLTSIGVALAHGEEGTSTLAANGLWNLISRFSQDRQFVQECLTQGVVGSLCGAAKGAADLLSALDEAAADDIEERPGMMASFTDSVASEALDEFNYGNEATADDEVFQRQMRATAKACLRSLHAILKHKWVRLDPHLEGMKEDLLRMLVSCSVAGTQVNEVSMAIMCNLSHDVCCDLVMLEHTGALDSILQQALSPSLVVLRHVSGILGNLSRVIVASSSDEGGPPRWKSRITVFDALKRLAYVDDQRLAFRTSAILYGLTRKRDYMNILPDLRGLGDVIFKLFRSGVPQTQNYCLQAFCNMAHNKDFAASIASDPDLMEGFIVGCMVHTNSSYMKEMSSEVLYYLISNPSTRLTALKGQGLWALVQLADANGSTVSMRLALLALFNLACDLRENARWLNENTVAAVLDFDDEVLGAPAFTGLLYLASTHHRRLSQMLISTRMALEARVKIEGAKFLKRDRALEEDKKFMARTTAALKPGDDEGNDSSSEEENATDRQRSFSTSKYFGNKQQGRLRRTFVASHLMPTLATVYNLCCKSGKATKLFFRKNIPEAVTGLLEEMRKAQDETYYHPQVEIMCVAVLSTMIENAALVPKLIERHVTPAITQGLDSRIVAVRLASLWSLLLLGIPGSGKNDDTTTAAPASAGKDHAGGGTQVRMWMLFCREAVVECKAVSALWTLWESTAATLEAGAREHMRYAISTVTRIFFMDKVAASAAVRQRGAELLALTMDFSADSRAVSPLSPVGENDSDYDESSSPLVKVSALCCAVVTVHLPDMPAKAVQSVCEGCLDVFLKVLPIEEHEVRDLCSLAMRCLSGNEELLLDLLSDPRFTTVLRVLLEEATPVGGMHIEAVLKRVVVLSAAPGVADLSPALLNLTDYVFQRRAGGSSRAPTKLTFSAAPPIVGGRAASGRAASQSTNGSVSSTRGAGVRGSKAAMNSGTGGVDRQVTRTIPGGRQHQASLAASGSGGSVASIRAHRMSRLKATRTGGTITGNNQGQKTTSEGRSNNSVKAPGGSEQDQVASAGPSALDPADAAAGVGVAGSADSAGSASTIAGNLNSKFNVFQDIVAETPAHCDQNNNTDDENDDGYDTDQGEGARSVPGAADAAGKVGALARIRPSVTKAVPGVSSRRPPSCSRVTAAQPPTKATSVGKHESVTGWGLGPSTSCDANTGGDAEHGDTGGQGPRHEEQGSMLERLNDHDHDYLLSDSSQTSDDEEDLEITYNDDEIRQVKRLVFRVVEADMSTTVVESVIEVVTQLREVARRQCTSFQHKSEEFRKRVLSTRKGEALPLPHSSRTCSNGTASASSRETSRESTPATSCPPLPRTAERPTATPPDTNNSSDNWDPAKQLLLLMGMQPLPMASGWEFDSSQSLKGRGAPKKVNLCTTKFVEECKTLTTTTVAVPIPLPEELVHFAQKGDAEMPSGLERCILPPLERPPANVTAPEPSELDESSVGTAVAAEAAAAASAAAASAAAAAATPSEHPGLEEMHEDVHGAVAAASDDVTPSSCNNAASRLVRRLSGEVVTRAGRGNSKHPRHTKQIDNKNRRRSVKGGREPVVEAEGSGAAARARNFSAGDRGSGGAGAAPNTLEGGGGTASSMEEQRRSLFCPGGVQRTGDKERGETTVGSWNNIAEASGVSPTRSLEEMFVESPLLAAFSVVETCRAETTGLAADVGSAGGGGGRCGKPSNRSAVPALAADMVSMRTQRSAEQREADRERQRLLSSLGVGTRRTLRAGPGKWRGLRVVTNAVGPRVRTPLSPPFSLATVASPVQL